MGKIIDFLLVRPPKKDGVIYGTRGAHVEIGVLLEELNNIKHMIPRIHEQGKYSPHKGLESLLSFLDKKQISKNFIELVRTHLEKTFTVEQLNDEAIVKKEYKKFLEAGIKDYKSPRNKNKQRKIILIGPTGAGKTTAMFKLVSYFDNMVQKKSRSTIRIANFDNHKIGSKESIDKIISCMEIEGKSFVKMNDLLAYAENGERPEILLVDTTGKNPKNKREILSCMQSYAPIMEEGETLLVIPANISEQDLRFLLQEYKVFNFRGVILTKMDEALNPTTTLGVCIELKIPLVFLSESQSYLDGFYEPKAKDILSYFNE